MMPPESTDKAPERGNLEFLSGNFDFPQDEQQRSVGDSIDDPPSPPHAISSDEVAEMIQEEVRREAEQRQPQAKGKAGGQVAEKQTDQKESPYAKFFFKTAGELVRDIRPTDFLILDFLETSVLAVIFGDPATCKSFMAIDWACSIATGHPWHGRPTKKGLVVYINGEGQMGFAKRLRAWEIGHDKPLAGAPLLVSTAPGQILDDSFCLYLELLIEEAKQKHGPPVMIVFDTLARNFGAGDENSTADMTRFIANLDRTLGDSCTRLLVHHSGHGDKNRGRGSSALKGAADVEIRLEKNGDQILMTCGKMKDAREFAPMAFVPMPVIVGTGDLLRPDTSLFLELGEAQPKKAKALSRNAQLALDTLIEVMGDQPRVDLETWRAEFYRRSSADNAEAKKKAFQRARTDLLDQGKIEVSDDQYRLSGQPGHIGTNRDNVPL